MTVPGPPRGRRRRIAGTLMQRIQTVKDAEARGWTPAALLPLLKDVLWLLKDLAADPRVPSRDKAVAAAAAAYLVSPIDFVPDAIPVMGAADELGLLAWSLRRLLQAAGYDVIYELWRGSDEGLALVLSLAGVQE